MERESLFYQDRSKAILPIRNQSYALPYLTRFLGIPLKFHSNIVHILFRNATSNRNREAL